MRATFLAAGDVMPLSEPRTLEPKLANIEAPWLARDGTTVHVVLGPQDDYFAKTTIDTFLAGPWTISPRSDRMAYLLDGPALTHAKGFNIVSDGIAFGAIQVPGDGKPVVLMADRQPTGGYPKIANVIGADLGKIAQLRPGARISFASVAIEEAVAARRAAARALARAIPREPLVRTEFPSEFLLGLNHGGDGERQPRIGGGRRDGGRKWRLMEAGNLSGIHPGVNRRNRCHASMFLLMQRLPGQLRQRGSVLVRPSQQRRFR